MNESTFAAAEMPPASEGTLAFREVAPLGYETKAQSARAKELAELMGRTRLQTLSRLAKKYRTAGPAARHSSIIWDGLNYGNWPGNRLKAIRDLEKSGTQLISEYVGRQEPHTAHSDSNRDAFLRSKEELLKRYMGKVVAFANGNLIGVADSFDLLADQLEDRTDCLRVYVDFVDQAAFRLPPPVEMPGAYEVYPPGGSLL
jgi:hypothetical protein